MWGRRKIKHCRLLSNTLQLHVNQALAPEQIAEQYVWRQAHVLRLQIPEDLQPPIHYTYVSQDGSLKLKASLYNPDDSWTDNSVEDDVSKDLRFGQTQGTSSEKYQKIFGY